MTSPNDSLDLRARSRVGNVLRGKWRLDRLLGVGGMAAVYAATHRNGNRVAIKVLHAERSADREARASFLREGYLANAVRHVDVVRVLDDDATDDGAAFLVMELIEGETLDARCARKGGTLPVGEVFAVVDAVLDVLQAAHAAGIFHRDIKPGNIMVTYDGRVKLLDFGIAHDVPSSGTMAAAGRGNAAARTAIGTPAFMAPEQACGGRLAVVDGRADLWALGATAFTMTSGALVHDVDDPVEQVKLAASTPARSLAEAAPATPSAVVAFIDRALAFDKAARFPTARAMRDALHETASELAISLALVDVPPPRPSSSRWLIEPHLHTAFPFYDAPPSLLSEEPLTREPSARSQGLLSGGPSNAHRATVVGLALAVIALPVFGLAFGRYVAKTSLAARPSDGSSSEDQASAVDSPVTAPPAAPATMRVLTSPSASSLPSASVAKSATPMRALAPR